MRKWPSLSLIGGLVDEKAKYPAIKTCMAKATIFLEGVGLSNC